VQQTRDEARIAELDAGLVEAFSAHHAQVAALEQALDAARGTTSSLAARVAELEEAIDAGDSLLETQRDEAAAALQKLDAEWSEKLQTIVGHLAGDHEVDLGEALVAKEEARAEVR